LNCDWVRHWHEIDTREDGEIIPSMVSNGQMVIITTSSNNVEDKKSTKVTGVLGRKAIMILGRTMGAIKVVGETLQNNGFFSFLNNERKWSHDMSSRVRGLEETGCKIMDMKVLQIEGAVVSHKEKLKEDLIRFSGSVNGLFKEGDHTHKKDEVVHYKIAPNVDGRLRHGLLMLPMAAGEFNNHAEASYGVNLEREREKDNARREAIREKEVPSGREAKRRTVRTPCRPPLGPFDYPVTAMWRCGDFWRPYKTPSFHRENGAVRCFALYTGVGVSVVFVMC